MVCGKERLNKISQEKILRQTQTVIVLLSVHPSIRVSKALCASGGDVTMILLRDPEAQEVH